MSLATKKADLNEKSHEKTHPESANGTYAEETRFNNRVVVQQKNYNRPPMVPRAISSEYSSETEQNTVFIRHTLPPNPVRQIRLQCNTQGWDGYRARPLSPFVVQRAEFIWRSARNLLPTDLPRVNASPDGYIAFSWSDHYPEKELHLNIHTAKRPMTWVLRGEIGNESGICLDTNDAAKIITRYGDWSSD